MKSKRVRTERVNCTRQFNADYMRYEVKSSEMLGWSGL